MRNLVRKLVPRSFKRAIRRWQERRTKARLFGALAPLVPAVEDMFEGPGSVEEFKANGEEFLHIYKSVCGLQPNERMLDVGSGIGRKALPLVHYLNEGASYEGIDVNAFGVEWCRQRITPRFPNFRFQRIDVHNPLYNPLGTCPPAEYRFPFPDESFSFVTLGSVFTHMVPGDVKHYLSEVNRVLSPGRCLISYFLLNDESRRLIASGASTQNFGSVRDGYATISDDLPENAIAFEEDFVTSLYRELGLRIARIDYGSWSGREQSLSYQDHILAAKD
ncbi:MAG: class I SAM-dependent methyltransferase [Acidobacteriota bacterium]|nr:class I SAM-dependent methyltransferase [Acidobacteriota bacterium]